ncbi:uncharacterized protein LOC108666550 [Hyalella azteca]|uniref:Uncharacterized protein LOC108666550 n=1 Tax=Hyalella azteca TaxID=294128 RepID=A0A8B7N4Z9_HYAAZ|nr:uncharacterized protein LOC108666550 [Hyalella azteca]
MSERVEYLARIKQFLYKGIRVSSGKQVVDYLVQCLCRLPRGDGIGKCPKNVINGNMYVHNRIEDWFVSKINECLQNKLIKEVAREAPCVKLRNNLSVYIRDISIKSHGPDEELYSKHEILRAHIPRGLTLLSIRDETGLQVMEDVVICALRKFPGATPEDDDDTDQAYHPHRKGSSSSQDFERDKYFLKPPHESKLVVATEKINGEMAHVSGRFIGNEFYFIAGSKNVHLVFQTEEDISHYTEERYSIASRIALAFLKKWQSLESFTASWLQIFFHHTRTTLVCEIKLPDHQHVVSFGSLSQDELVVIALTPPPQEDCQSLTALPEETTLQFFSMLGFCVTQYECVEYIAAKNLFLETRLKWNTEGIVCYYEDSNRNTIGILKLKSQFYIHLRALRQQASYRYVSKKSAKNPQKTLEEAKGKSRRRMEELRDWLQTSSEQLQCWQQLSDYWFEWLDVQDKSKSFELSQVRNNFPAVFGPFSSSSQNVVDVLRRLEMGSPAKI